MSYDIEIPTPLCGKKGRGPDGKEHQCILPAGHICRCKCDCGAKGAKFPLKLAHWKRGRKKVA